MTASATRQMAEAGPCPFTAFAESVAPHRAIVRRCLDRAALFTPREIEFLESIAAQVSLSAPQAEWLAALAEREPIDFDKINAAARVVLLALLKRWLPDGKQRGKEWVALNPTRGDTHAGSFKINAKTGEWGDFATGDRGGDPVSLAAYLHHAGDQRAAALALKAMLGG